MSRVMWTRTPWLVAIAMMAIAPFALAQSRSGSRTTTTTTTTATTAPASPTVPAVAADVCVPQASADTTIRCEGTSTRIGHSGSTAPPGAARATADDRAKAKNAKKAGGPTVQLDEATARRRGNLQRRARDILEREVQLTAQLVRNMNRGDANRPNALMRLAENIQELGSAENSEGQEMNEQIFQAQRANNAAQVTALRRTQEQHFTAARNQRGQLIRVFETLVTDHPTFQRMDAVLFYLAFAYQDSRDQTNARRVYQVLISRFPQSPFVPNAYLSFAEFFFEAGDMDSAAQFYRLVIQIDTPENSVRGYAMYKMAWVEYNLTHFEASLQQFYDVITYGRAHTDNPSITPLIRSARGELVSAYGAVYGVSRPLNAGTALNQFRRYAADENNAFEMLEKLAELYQDNGQWANSVTVYHELMAQRAENDRFCHWQAQVAKAVVASGRRDDQARELDRLIDVYEAYRGPQSRRSTEARALCRDSAARIVFDVASHWHLEAIGRSAEGQVQTRGTRDPQTMQRAARYYNTLLEKFPDFDSVTFPDYDRRDWPSRYRIAYYAADILRDQQNFAECGPAYDRVVEMNPTGEYTEDAAYKAVLCYNDQFTRELAARSRVRPTAASRGRQTGAQQDAAAAAAASARLTPRDFNTQESGMLRAFGRYVCYASSALQAQRAGGAAAATPTAQQQAAGGADADEDPRTVILTIKYRRAYLYYAANKFEEASTLFRDIALPADNDPSRDAPDPENLREIAADLYLDAMVVMGQQWSPPRPACFDRMDSDVPRIKERFCSATTRTNHVEFCNRMDLLGCQILRKRAEALSTARRFSECGRAYVEIVRNHQECRAQPEARADEMLYNAAICYDAANMLGRSMRVRDSLINVFLPRNSAWAQRALYRLGGNYHAIQVFSRAADYYERYADYVNDNRAAATTADPQSISQAADALRQATLFRIGLGEEQRALDNAAKFARYFGNDAERRRQAASVVFSIGQIYQDRAARAMRRTDVSAEQRQTEARTAWREVIRHYTSFVNRYARQGTLDQQIQGNVALGRGYLNIDDQTNSQLYFRAAVAVWGEAAVTAEGTSAGGAPSRGETTIREQLRTEGDAAIAEAVEKSKDSVAEARFFLADGVYRRFMQRRLPTYRGGASRSAFDRWTQTALTPYIQTQQQYLQQEATQQFQQVIAMHVPNWEIAAAARLADMFYQFAKIIREAPMPPDFRNNEELRATYGAMIDERTQPLIDLAKRGYQLCIARATQVHWFNEWSQLCERNLNNIDRRAFPLADELRVEPNLLFSRASNARIVTAVGGTEDDDAASGGTPDTAPPTGGATTPATTPAGRR